MNLKEQIGAKKALAQPACKMRLAIRNRPIDIYKCESHKALTRVKMGDKPRRCEDE